MSDEQKKRRPYLRDETLALLETVTRQLVPERKLHQWLTSDEKSISVIVKLPPKNLTPLRRAMEWPSKMLNWRTAKNGRDARARRRRNAIEEMPNPTAELL